jgi:hypothetical protein
MTLPTGAATRNLIKTLGRIASAEKLEQQCRRARDPEGMFRAITKKMEEQARYIVLRDAATAIKRSMGGPGRGKHIESIRVVFPAGDPGDDMAYRWRKAFCSKNGAGTEIDLKKVRLALEDARARCLRICEQHSTGTIRGTEGTGEFERYTPARYIELARSVLGTIDLDPASCKTAQKWIAAGQFFTTEEDGLQQNWVGNVWLNPPYHRELGPKFVYKLVAELASGRTLQAIMLTNNSTDTDWFRVAAEACQAICFTTGRIPFLKADGVTPVNPTQGQAFFYFGADSEAFCREFSSIGFVVVPDQCLE